MLLWYYYKNRENQPLADGTSISNDHPHIIFIWCEETHAHLHDMEDIKSVGEKENGGSMVLKGHVIKDDYA